MSALNVIVGPAPNESGRDVLATGMAELEARGGPPIGRPSSSVSTAARYEAIDADFMERSEEAMLVKRLLPHSGLCLIAAASMSGKTFLVLDIISKIAKGQDVLGRRSHRSGIVYVAAEGGGGIGKRVEGLRKEVGPWGGLLRIVTASLNLGSEDDVSALRESLEGVANQMKSQGERLGAVVIDTLAAATPGVDENASKDMGMVLGTLQQIALDMSLCCIVVAHVGKDAEKGVRGWSGMFANADTVIILKPPIERVRVGVISKVKDGEAGEEFAFALDQVDLGTDLDGDEVNTCVVRMVDVPPFAKAKPRRRSYAEAEPDEVLRAFDEVVRIKPHDLPVSVGNREKVGVLLHDLRDHLFANGFHSEDRAETMDAAAEIKFKDARRAAFGRAAKSLYVNGKLRRDGQLVWVP